MPRQTIGTPIVSGQSLEEVRQSSEFWLRHIVNYLDEIIGVRGTPTFYNDVNANGRRIQQLGIPQTGSDAQRFDLCLHASEPGGHYDAGGQQILNVMPATEDSQAVNLAQLQALLAEASALLANLPFVVVALSDALTNERQLAAEATVLELADAGANSTLTVGVAANGITDPKLRQGAATSVVGRSANSVGNVADIAASADTQVLTRVGGVLGFSLLVTSGTYTPTLNNVANLDASTAYECQWLRVGSVVTVSGKVDVDPTAAGSTQLGISLPVASNLGAEEDCAGTSCCPTIAGQSAAIRGDAANDRAEMVWIAVDTTNQAMFFTFTYSVL